MLRLKKKGTSWLLICGAAESFRRSCRHSTEMAVCLGLVVWQPGSAARRGLGFARVAWVEGHAW